MEIEELKAFANEKLDDEFKEKLASKLTDDTIELLGFIQSLVDSMGDLMKDSKHLALLANIGVVVSVCAGGEDAIFASFGHKGSCKKAVEQAMREISDKENE